MVTRRKQCSVGCFTNRRRRVVSRFLTSPWFPFSVLVMFNFWASVCQEVSWWLIFTPAWSLP